ncbi:hypothetical protein V5799_014907 [Amblyomma americanum]|uniref:Uncharacterized protein n=1 Tax=Amblyomma americanum TaxID=6943 RepID=A0AAQ4E1N6_AMBAM
MLSFPRHGTKLPATHCARASQQQHPDVPPRGCKWLSAFYNDTLVWYKRTATSWETSPTWGRINAVVNWRHLSGHGNGPTVTMLDVSYLRFVQVLICLACCPIHDTESNYQLLIVPAPVSNSTRTYRQAAVNGFSAFYNDTFVWYKRTATSWKTSPTSERINTVVNWRRLSGHGNGPTVIMLDVSYLRFVQVLICLACCPFYDTEPNYQPLIVPVPVSNSTRTYRPAAVNGFSAFYTDTLVWYKSTATSWETSPTWGRINAVVNWRHLSGHGNGPTVTMLDVSYLRFVQVLICLACCPFHDTESNYQLLIVPAPVSNSTRTYRQAAVNGFSAFYNDTFVWYKRTATSWKTSPTSERINTVVNWRRLSGHGNGPTVIMLDVSYLRFVQVLICLACCPFYDTEPNYQPLIVPVPVSNSTRTYRPAAVNGFSAFYTDTLVWYKSTATSWETSPTSKRINTVVNWRHLSEHGNGPTVTMLDVSYLRFFQVLICLACCPFHDTETNYQPLIVTLPVSNSTRTCHQAAVNGFSAFYNDTFVCYKRTATSWETSPTSERINTVVNWRHLSGHGNGPTVTMLDVSYL